MDPNRLTERSQDAVRAAQALAARLSHQQIDNEHLLAALLEQENGVVPEVLLRAGVKLEALHQRLMAELEKLPKVAVSQGGGGGMYVTQRLERTFAEARHYGLLAGVRYGEPFVQKEVGLVDDLTLVPVQSI